MREVPTIHSGSMLLLIALAIWTFTEVMEFVLRRRANQTVFTSHIRVPVWVRGLNVLALIFACAGFVMLLALDSQFFGTGF